ncbi:MULTISPECIES: 6,7-dimethyl-8-ribityllumazine synthase [Acidianus]|uniref:6,7-dimethyl-8-ribityllumazine synthase n=1 Tax=Candidatus Acidianus copahuensis TaxID=1160895 RepID=A0A031LLL8_9CREN|nr:MULTISPECIES: 6,7-dimethyl-8-ribityllumazine synthase [Acidianus]EZQ03102.1 6,7-dimethyl-8-ribityllumazine synthase [Candidatus Acidianus copahuensis]NON62472.1 6,7-dimethyl-8-ribityllumazine synthase [Acidianus sp. RZ1]
MQEASIKLGIVVAEFNYDITKLMLDRAISHIEFLGGVVQIIFSVPGSFEIPLAVKKLAKRDDIDGIVVLGAIIKGETKHDDLIGNQVARLISDISLEYEKPVALGIIGPGATHEQAMERIEEYSTRAAESAIKMIRRLRKMEYNKEKVIK